MKHLIVGTAGHVDHGKTALIKYLTGTDTDRLKEEKNRGISIDIGFAALRCDEDTLMGIVDVPGHERFLKNMLAGTGGIDLTLLVIAADEGVMPQTREHFEMLECFGIQAGLVVITKIDKVDVEWLEMVQEEVKEYLEGTFLSDAPICKVSSVTGEGMEALRQALQEEAAKLVERDRQAPFRLWIDRAFNLKGQGLIVTGSVLSGAARTGDTVVLQPERRQVRIREIESHNQSATEVGAGQRASFNLSGISLAEVERGMLLSEAGYGQKSRGWDALVHWRKPYPSGTRIRFHIGTGEFIGRMARAQGFDARQELVRLYLERPIVAALGDRGLLRRYSPQNLIGGIILLCPAGREKSSRSHLEALADKLGKKDQTGIMYELLRLSQEPLSRMEWSARAGFVNKAGVEAAIKINLASGAVKQVGNYYITAAQMSEIQAEIVKMLAEYHCSRANEPGMSREVLRQQLHLAGNFADLIFQDVARQGSVKLEGEYLSLASHAAKHGEVKEGLFRDFEAIMPVQELIEVTPEWLAEKMQRSLKEIKPFYDGLIRGKILIRLAGVHVYRKTIQYIGEAIHQHFQQKTTLSVGEFRDLAKTSRRLAIPLLEYFDLHKITIRQGDVRLSGPNSNNLSE